MAILLIVSVSPVPPALTAYGRLLPLRLGLVDSKTGKNAFGDADDPQGITDVCRSFIAGQLRFARTIDAVIAPTVNCLRRRRPHTFSPSNISWGLEDRSALLRVKGGAPESTHTENRGPTALSNPYLVGAALLSAGLAGIDAVELSAWHERRLDHGDQRAM